MDFIKESLLKNAQSIYIFHTTVVQRLKILEYAKSKLHSRSCKFAKEIFCLLDREEELLNRGIKQSLAGLRLRISNLFLAHIERNLDGLR